MEFALIYYISQIKTERMAIIDDITMGAGVGFPIACSIRVATPRTSWGMPENPIGFVPYVGASYFLSKLDPLELGLYLAITSDRLNGADFYNFGIAEYYVEDVENWDFLKRILKRFSKHVQIPSKNFYE